MPTREEALVELAAVFRLISEEYGERKESLPADTTEIESFLIQAGLKDKR
jgi:hypothetical protein